jgi:dephospho-CoA kinase
MPETDSPLRKIGLTGGIASGKSTVAKWLREAGFTVVDLDAIGKELTDSDPAVIQAIDALCGGGVTKKGKLDRNKVRQIVFGNPRVKQQLEDLLHPRILARFSQLVDGAKQVGEHVIFCEAALHYESGYARECDSILLVTAPREQQKSRLMQRDGISGTLAEQMISSQWSDEEKQKQGGLVLRNDGTLEMLKKRLDRVMAQLGLDLAQTR